MRRGKTEESKISSRLPLGSGHDPLGLRVVCVSDTHGRHRNVVVPAGDVLIHAGDFTHFGKMKDVQDFNTWLGELPHRVKIVVNGNHECNAEWSSATACLLSNATFLCDQGIELKLTAAANPKDLTTTDGGAGTTNGTASSAGDVPLRVFGTQFYWPNSTPRGLMMPREADILVTHGPVLGFVDGNGAGCPVMLAHVEQARPRLVVCGHIHQAHGVKEGTGSVEGVTFVNAANARQGYSMGWEAVVVDI